MFYTPYTISLGLLIASFPSIVSSTNSETSTICNQQQRSINHFLNSTQELTEPQPQKILPGINLPANLPKPYPKIYPPTPQCAGTPSNRPSIPKAHAKAKILDYCAEITRTIESSRLDADSHISLTYPIPNEPSDSDEEKENELWFSIFWNPKCGRGKTRVVRSRCESYLNSLLEKCNIDDDDIWGGEVMGTCLVYSISSSYERNDGQLIVGMNETVLVPMKRDSGAGRSNGGVGYSPFAILFIVCAFGWLVQVAF